MVDCVLIRFIRKWQCNKRLNLIFVFIFLDDLAPFLSHILDFIYTRTVFLVRVSLCHTRHLRVANLFDYMWKGWKSREDRWIFITIHVSQAERNTHRVDGRAARGRCVLRTFPGTISLGTFGKHTERSRISILYPCLHKSILNHMIHIM